MKNLFKRQDGTFKVLPITIFSFVLTAIILGALSFPLFIKEKEATVANVTTTTTASDSGDSLMCKECDIEFYDSKLTLAVGEGVKIKDILNLKDVELINVSLKYDSDYLEKKQVNGEYYLYAKDVLGDVEVTATYHTYTTKMTITITSDSITSASFDKDIYYIYKGETTSLDISTSPKGASLKLVALESNDESIAKFNSSDKIVGVETGKTTIKLTVGEVTDTATVYVVENDIKVKVKIDGVYTEEDSYKYSSSEKTMNLYLAVKFEDNNKKGYTQSDLTSEIVSHSGSLSGVLSFDSVYSADSSTYIYKLVVNYSPSDATVDNSILISFGLPDGSIKLFEVYK